MGHISLIRLEAWRLLMTHLKKWSIGFYYVVEIFPVDSFIYLCNFFFAAPPLKLIDLPGVDKGSFDDSLVSGCFTCLFVTKGVHIPWLIILPLEFLRSSSWSWLYFPIFHAERVCRTQRCDIASCNTCFPGTRNFLI